MSTLVKNIQAIYNCIGLDPSKIPSKPQHGYYNHSLSLLHDIANTHIGTSYRCFIVTCIIMKLSMQNAKDRCWRFGTNDNESGYHLTSTLSWAQWHNVTDVIGTSTPWLSCRRVAWWRRTRWQARSASWWLERISWLYNIGQASPPRLFGGRWHAAAACTWHSSYEPPRATANRPPRMSPGKKQSQSRADRPLRGPLGNRAARKLPRSCAAHTLTVRQFYWRH